jgi:hypothetical protein
MANYTKATNFLAKDSLATGDPAKIIKGSEFDTEFNALQTAVNSKANSISPAFTGTPTAPTAASGTSTTQLATTEFVASTLFPSGGIIIWSGSSATIPTGWVLCNGSNSTPDLRNRFVVGAGSTYAVGATGGSANAVVVSHTHTATVATTSLTGTITNQYTAGDTYGSTTGVFSQSNGNVDGDGGESRPGRTINFDGSHTHTATISTEGVSGTNANLPPYYALCYIMKS